MRKERIGSFLKRIKNTVEIQDSIAYKRVTIKTKHQGIFLRDVAKGVLIGTKSQFTIKEGQFLLSKIDARFGAFGIVPTEVNGGIITGNFWAYEVDKKKVNIDWFNLFTSSGNFYDICDRASSGTTHRKYLDEKTFLNFEILLPELDEQNEFIKRHNEYLVSYSDLTSEISSQQTYIQQLRQAILQEAVQGKLVPQDPKDEPAEKLLERIKAEKEKLVKEGKLKKEKPLAAITEDEIPFELPKGWAWCRLGEICYYITDGTHQTPKYVEKGMPFLSAQNIKPFKFMPEVHKYVSEEDYQAYVRNKKPEKGDVLITRVGSGIGEAAVIDIDFDFAIYVSLGLLKFNKHELFSNYIELFLNSPVGRTHSNNNTLGRGFSAGNLNLNLIRNFVFPLPPFNEQKRIVAKVAHLMQYCDELEQQINASKTDAEQLLQVVLREAFEGKSYATDEAPLRMVAEE